jgi:hypothetical protein
MSSMSRVLLASVAWFGISSNGWCQDEKPKAGDGERVPILLNEKPAEPGPKDDRLTKLLKERYGEALGELQDRMEEVRIGRTTPGDEHVLGALNRVLDSGLELCPKPSDKVDHIKKCLDFADYAEKNVQKRFDAGAISRQTLHRIRYARADLEIKLLRTEVEAKKAEKDRR